MIHRFISVFISIKEYVKKSIIPNGPTVCKIREENYDKNTFVIKRPTYGKKKNYTKISCFIGEFHTVHYYPMLKKYAYPRILLCFLGKHECNNLRREAFLTKNNYVMIERDYYEEWKE